MARQRPTMRGREEQLPNREPPNGTNWVSWELIRYIQRQSPMVLYGIVVLVLGAVSLPVILAMPEQHKLVAYIVFVGALLFFACLLMMINVRWPGHLVLGEQNQMRLQVMKHEQGRVVQHDLSGLPASLPPAAELGPPPHDPALEEVE